MNLDKHNMLDVLRNLPDMIKKASHLGEDISVPKDFVENIAVTGMGGSGFTGDLLKIYLRDLPIPVHVIKDYTLPKYISRKSLVFAISYSGNTEETISAYRAALRRSAKIITISSGGKLEELAKMNNNPHIKVPSGVQPRLSTSYLFIPILNVLHFSGIIEDPSETIEVCMNDLISSREKVEASAKELAAKIRGKTPIIYTSQQLFAVAEKWKTDINENAKTTAFYNMFPEFNHNEICGYQNPKGSFHTIILNDADDHERIKKRITGFKKVMKSYNAEITEIAVSGENYLTRLLSTVWMGTYLGYFLALEYETDPTPVDIIEKFKKDLEK